MGKNRFFIKRIDLNSKFSIIFKNKSVWNKIKFYIAGPDYNKGLGLLINKIDKDKLQEHVKILKKTLENINIFKNADYNILLSRWDGFPRSLREFIL